MTPRLHPTVGLSLLLLVAERPVSARHIRAAAARVVEHDADAWGRAVRHLLGHGLLVESTGPGGHTQWSAGPGLESAEWVRLATAEQWAVARGAWGTHR